MSRGHQIIAHRLRQLGVSTLFGVMGDGNLQVIRSFVDLGGRYVAARHESGAVAMADGYARVTGEVGVATCTLGPGLTNATTALVSARKAGSPVVLVSGDVPNAPHRVRSLLEVQRIDQATLARSVGLTMINLEIGSIASGVASAVESAQRLSRPVVLLVPKDLQDDWHDEEAQTPHPSQSGAFAEDGPAPDAVSVDEAMSALRASRRRVILAGRGAVEANARQLLLELGRRMPAFLGTTLRAKDLFQGEPATLDIVGGYSSALTKRALEEADCVLVMGASLNDHTTVENELVGSHQTIIRCDIDKTSIEQGPQVRVGVVADARELAQILVDRLSESELSIDQEWFSSTREGLLSNRRDDEYSQPATDRGLDPRWLAMRLDESLPPRVLVVDSGHFSGFANVYIHVDEPRDYVFAHDFGAVGLGMGSAIGAAIGRPEDRVVLVLGDGGLMMSLVDLDTAARERLGLVVIVFNDGGYGAEAHRLRLAGADPGPALFANPSFEDVARSLGCAGVTLRTPEDLARLHDLLGDTGRPLLVDCHLDPTVRSRTMDALYRNTAG